LTGHDEKFNVPQTPTIQKFVIFSQVRSGSNFLVSLLNRGIVSLDAEIFNPSGFWGAIAENTTWDVSSRDQHRNGFLNEFWDADSVLKRTGRSTITHVGFKNLEGQLRPKEFQSLEENDDVKKIVLWRESSLEKYVSYEIARVLGAWDGVDTSNLTVHVDPQEFKNHAMEYDEWKDCIWTNRPSWFHIDFKDLVQDTDNVLRGVHKFLGIDQDIPHNTTGTKQSNTTLDQHIENWDQLVHELQGTAWEWETGITKNRMMSMVLTDDA